MVWPQFLAGGHDVGRGTNLPGEKEIHDGKIKGEFKKLGKPVCGEELKLLLHGLDRKGEVGGAYRYSLRGAGGAGGENQVGVGISGNWNRRLDSGQTRQRFASLDLYVIADPGLPIENQDAAAESFYNCRSEQTQTFGSDKQDIRPCQIKDSEQPLFRKQGVERDVTGSCPAGRENSLVSAEGAVCQNGCPSRGIGCFFPDPG